MLQHGRLNSRLKDYFDIRLLARHFEFDGNKLAQAIAATFAKRQTPLIVDPIGLLPEFATQPGKQEQWAGFLRKIGVGDVPVQLVQVVAELHAFLGPVLESLVRGKPFARRWVSGGPWVAAATSS